MTDTPHISQQLVLLNKALDLQPLWWNCLLHSPNQSCTTWRFSYTNIF